MKGGHPDTAVHIQRMQPRASEDQMHTLELPVFLSMTRLKAFKVPNGSRMSFTCEQQEAAEGESGCLYCWLQRLIRIAC